MVYGPARVWCINFATPKRPSRHDGHDAATPRRDDPRPRARGVHRLASVVASVVENGTQAQAGDSPEVSQVASDELEVVMNGGSGDLQVGVCERAPGLLEPS